MNCNLVEAAAFNVYYLLPHYHEWGTKMRVQLIGGSRDGELLFETDQAIGGALGQTFDPPRNLGGATGLRVTCRYDNPSDGPLFYGLANGEMCVLLGYTDYRWKLLGSSSGAAQEVPTSDDVLEFQAPCEAGLLP